MNRIVWIDTETTGLKYWPGQDHLLEVACIVTDLELNTLGTFERVLKLTPETEARLVENVLCLEMHAKTGLLDETRLSKHMIASVEDELCEFLQEHGVVPRTACMAGNSVWFDRCMLETWMPKVLNHMPHQLLDVTSIWKMKVCVFPDGKNVSIERPNGSQHRAMFDIMFSIEQFRALIKIFKV